MPPSTGKGLRSSHKRPIQNSIQAASRDPGENNRAIYLRTARRDRQETRPKPTTAPAHMDIRPFTESQTSVLTRST